MILFRLVVLLLCFTSVATIAAPNKLNGVRVSESADKTRVVFELSTKPAYKAFFLKKPNRLVFDFHQSQKSFQVSSVRFSKALIRNIRTAERNNGAFRLVLDLNSDVSMTDFTLDPTAKHSYRVVADLYTAKQKLSKAKSPPTKNKIRPIVENPAAIKPRKPTRSQYIDQPKLRDVIIAIDAGHGGNDPGAIGKRGYREKIITLAIAKELAKLVTREKGMKPLLIRDGDYYVELRNRVRKARNSKADLFLSIHADSFRNRAVKGASVFALSRRGATSEMARMLARRENNSDLIGGIGGKVELPEEDKVLASVLLDLSQTASMSASLNFGGMVLNNLNQMTELHKFSVEKANFMVLRAPDIPSVLIETGFISNPKEEKRLGSRSYQRKLANSIMSSLKKYFSKNPPPGTVLYAKKYGKDAWFAQSNL